MSAEPRGDVETEIKQLERDKLAEEIKQLKASGKRQWITPAALTGLIPILAGLGIWLVNEMKQYNEGYVALAQRDALEAEKAELQRQKDSLSTEITTLLALKSHYAQEAKDLQAKVEERQKQLDEAYLRARFAGEEARYALSHVKGMGPRLNRSELSGLRSQIRNLPDSTAGEMDRLFDLYALSSEMIDVTDETLDTFSKAFDQVPVSDWARQLEHRPSGFFNGRNVMVLEKYDGAQPRYYDVDAGRFLTPEESRSQ